MPTHLKKVIYSLKSVLAEVEYCINITIRQISGNWWFTWKMILRYNNLHDINQCKRYHRVNKNEQSHCPSTPNYTKLDYSFE